MQISRLIGSLPLLALLGGTASATTIAIGTPADAYLATPSTVSPRFGSLINFDSLTPLSTLAPGQFSAQGVTSIASPDGLVVYPYSSQSAPNEVFDSSADGSANISIKLAAGANQVGIGIADSDITAGGSPVTIILQALSSTGVGFGAVFDETITEVGPNPGNGYFVISDTSNDIYGLSILQPIGDAALFSGLAIDDLQFAAGTPVPEPATVALFGTGLALVGFIRSRKRVRRSA
jgi:hypothetical protein